MKSAAIVALLLIIAVLADRVVRIENQRYALSVDLCKYDAAKPPQRGDCLQKVQTRTSWFWHLYYAMTQSAPPVPLWTE